MWWRGFVVARGSRYTYTYSTSGPVSTWTGDRLRADSRIQTTVSEQRNWLMRWIMYDSSLPVIRLLSWLTVLPGDLSLSESWSKHFLSPVGALPWLITSITITISLKIHLNIRTDRYSELHSFGSQSSRRVWSGLVLLEQQQSWETIHETCLQNCNQAAFTQCTSDVIAKMLTSHVDNHTACDDVTEYVRLALYQWRWRPAVKQISV